MSGLVDVASAAPGASRSTFTMNISVLPHPIGPMTRVERSPREYRGTPRGRTDCPRLYPYSLSCCGPTRRCPIGSDLMVSPRLGWLPARYGSSVALRRRGAARLHLAVGPWGRAGRRARGGGRG